MIPSVRDFLVDGNRWIMLLEINWISLFHQWWIFIHQIFSQIECRKQLLILNKRYQTGSDISSFSFLRISSGAPPPHHLYKSTNLFASELRLKLKVLRVSNDNKGTEQRYYRCFSILSTHFTGRECWLIRGNLAQSNTLESSTSLQSHNGLILITDTFWTRVASRVFRYCSLPIGFFFFLFFPGRC